ncbi:hypothetical protein CTRI78_v007280 [Colletotrichum trifolii]|uniref:Uncharacterized protein n=1 Tax=Colletotrichum trifolii TaxID=5466 RepID=A0A4R8RCL6_COLTR|nr:hypothetical protein CTRI78_v007280 [Colletotrichum trifolii]
MPKWLAVLDRPRMANEPWLPSLRTLSNAFLAQVGSSVKITTAQHPNTFGLPLVRTATLFAAPTALIWYLKLTQHPLGNAATSIKLSSVMTLTGY